MHADFVIVVVTDIVYALQRNIVTTVAAASVSPLLDTRSSLYLFAVRVETFDNMIRIRFVCFFVPHFFFLFSFSLQKQYMENTLDMCRHPLGRNHMAEEIYYKTMTTTSTHREMK